VSRRGNLSTADIAHCATDSAEKYFTPASGVDSRHERAAGERLMEPGRTCDLLIIGGGINGAGIARDAAGRGLAVALCERADFAGATSSASTKLIHGGLRYLEHGELRMVRDALRERGVLLAIAPHISRQLRFVLPHVRELRPAWMIRLGLLLYDHLGTRPGLPLSQSVDLHGSPYGEALKPELRKGFVYSDAWVDDARLVILNLRSALLHGAAVLPRTRFVSARPEQHGWLARLESAEGRRFDLRARVLINAAGPWVDDVLSATSATPARPRVRLVKGSHLVVQRLYDGDHAYLLQNEDRRIVFVIPFGANHTVIGTTDVPVDSPYAAARISPEEIEYLCRAATRYLRKSVAPEQMVWSYTGVRALADDGHEDPSSITRDYTLALDQVQGSVVLSILGGKLTVYRTLAEAALAKLRPWLEPRRGKWTASEPLPGGDLGAQGMSGLKAQLSSRYRALPLPLVHALAERHGTLAGEVLGDARGEADLGIHFGGGLFEREVDYLIRCEWAHTGDDVLWRRTKAGLEMPVAERSRVDAYVRERVAREPMNHAT
jgi:glycerol-3-phosphate dehydrogenase